MEGHALLGASLAVAPSLDTIPGSTSPTPALLEQEDLPPPLLCDIGTFEITASDNGSRSSSLVPVPVQGSYFPAPPTSSPGQAFPSRASTPGERSRPPALSIPSASADGPLFSAYPDPGPSRPESRSKGRSFTFPLKPSFALQPGAARRRSREGSEDSSADEQSTNKGREMSGPVIPSRRRASSISSLAFSDLPAREDQHRSSHAAPIIPTRSFRTAGGRRASISLASEAMTHWPVMASQEARRISPKADQLPYSYTEPADADSEYTLESVSTVATLRPLDISPRTSSLTAAIAAHAQGGVTIVLGLPNITGSSSDQPIEVVIPEDMAIPHEPPPRRSSLDFGSRVIFELKPSYDTDSHPTIAHVDIHSILSSSLTGTDNSVTGTDTSASADTYSPSPSTKAHPLSSATTSLSRSAKSGQEGSDEKDGALSAVRLQRSLEWEARQDRHHRRVEKRRMILFELVETEVSYVEDLRILVQVYLPQLYALPSVFERSAGLIARNSAGLLEFHAQFLTRMVDILKEEGLCYESQPELFMSRKLERISRRLAALFVDEVAGFSEYKEYCSGSIAAATLVRRIAERADFDSYEKRCQIIGSSQPDLTLKDLLTDEAHVSPTTSSNRSRLQFRDFLIMPIQRVCRYPLLLNQLLDSATTPSSVEDRPEYDDSGDEYDIGVDVERALVAMRGVAEEADEARRVKEVEIKSATVLERMDIHPAVTPALLKSLGTCRLIGSLDVLHHHPVVAPLVPPVKVKYLAAFLYRGYLVLARVKKGKVYEPKHFLPLEVFELIDITEGFLPHSIRLALREHNFDLAASCETEKAVWAAALCEARDESNVPPFELPASVFPVPMRSRRMSVTAPPPDFAPIEETVNKRHTVGGATLQLHTPVLPPSPEEAPVTPPPSPSRSSFGSTPDRRPGQPWTILLRRASATQRLLVDRGLIDVFSESCATARSKAQLNHALFLPDVPPAELRDRMSIRESTMLRRRRSFLDTRSASFDIEFTGEIRGSVIPLRQTRSSAGKQRTLPVERRRDKSSGSRGNESATEIDGRTSTDETITSDFETLTGRPAFSRAESPTSISRVASSRRSLSNLRRTEPPPLNRRKSASASNLKDRPGVPNRANSMPSSPIAASTEEVPPLPLAESAYAAPEPDGSPASTFNSGSADQPERHLPSSKWESLRRNMSFGKNQRASAISLMDLASSVDLTEPRSSDEGTSMNHSTVTLSENDETKDTSATSNVPRTPKKKRNSLFQSLSRFTPI